MRILICGLNGVGKSTIGKKLAEYLSYQFIDNEDLYFPKEDKSYEFTNPRSKEEVINMLNKEIDKNKNFVFSAVRGDYGEKLLSQLDYIFIVEVPREIRLKRVRNRSFSKFGKRILDGGDLAQKENDWFAFVDSRPEDYVTKWLETINRTSIHIDGTRSIEENVKLIVSIIYKIQMPIC